MTIIIHFKLVKTMLLGDLIHYKLRIVSQLRVSSVAWMLLISKREAKIFRRQAYVYSNFVPTYNDQFCNCVAISEYYKSIFIKVFCR